MSHVLKTFVRALVVSGIATAVPLFAQADNTKANAGDRAKGAVTADQQKENPTDRALTQKIRQALVHDKTLSTYAHNVKVISQDGHVTLKGPVRSQEELKTVEAKATTVAGAGRVTNELTVAPPESGKTKG